MPVVVPPVVDGLFCDYKLGLKNAGRTRAVIFILLGLLSIGLGFAFRGFGTGWTYVIFMGTVGIFLIGLGCSLVKDPDWETLSGLRPLGRPVERKRLLTLLPRLKRPYYVCGSCDVLYTVRESVGECNRCGTVSQCYKVENADDVVLVTAALTE